MNIRLLGWGGLVIFLCISTFGLWWCITILLSLLVTLMGGITVLYLKHGDASQQYYTKLYQSQPTAIKAGLQKVLLLLDDPAAPGKLDRRLTGSHVIDESLQEVLGYVLRDHVAPWYERLSTDAEFTHQLRLTAQTVVVTFSNRMKEVDWIPYLTTRLVDDAASHLRLFRQARAKMKQKARKVHSQDSSSSPDSKRSATEPIASVDLESIFFDLEVTMESNHLCRDLVCTDENDETQYLRDVVEVLLFLLLPSSDFHCKPLRFLLRELLVSSVVAPLLRLFSDPDYINQTILWICRDIPLSSESFMTSLRVTDNLDELSATCELVSKEVAHLRSRDSGGEDDTAVKQQLSSLLYVRKVIDNRTSRLQEGVTDTDSAGLPSTMDWSHLLSPGCKLFSLPLDVVLKNNIALSYFIDYTTGIGLQAYLFFYLNVEGWRVSAEQQISDVELQKLKAGDGKSAAGALPAATLENMKDAAYSIFEQYLSDKASPKLKIDETAVKKLVFKLRTETPTETWFDEIQSAIYDKLQFDERFLPGFRASTAYVKLLAELDLLKDSVSQHSDDDSHSLDDICLSDNVSLASLDLLDQSGEVMVIEPVLPPQENGQPAEVASKKPSGPFTLLADIIETAKAGLYTHDTGSRQSANSKRQRGVVNDHGRTYGVYALSASRVYESGHVEKWHVYRRYSDFHDLQQKVKDKFVDLAKLTFPGKKAFHNMDRSVLERRMRMLNDYLQIVLQAGVVDTHPGLQGIVQAFLEPGQYDKSYDKIARTFDSLLRTSVRQVGAAVQKVPDTFISTMDGVMDGISKVFQSRGLRPEEAMKVGASLHVETDDNIPLRIMLLLADEVFDLKSRNQWLRRRIVTLLRQIIRTMFGDIVNRRILDYVGWATSPEQVAEYLRSFKNSFWPHGVKAEPRTKRDEATQLRTRVAAKVALLSSLSDELKHIIGSETTRQGILCVFELFQRPVLNRRLILVLLEGILDTLFPRHHLAMTFRRLHSRSARVRDDFRASQRTKTDLRR